MVRLEKGYFDSMSWSLGLSPSVDIDTGTSKDATGKEAGKIEVAATMEVLKIRKLAGRVCLMVLAVRWSVGSIIWGGRFWL